jgi:multiple sugar transport system substrate-binding protein
MKKWVPAALVVSLFSTFTIGCGGGAAPSSSSQPAASGGSSSGGATSDKKVEITFARGQDPTTGTKNMIKAFEDKNPNIKVNFLELPNKSDAVHNDFVTKFSTGDTSVDVFGMDIVWPSEFGAAKWVLPLNDYFTKDELDKLLPGPVQGNTYKGTLYGIPYYTDAGVLFYRKDILDQAGLKPPKTFDELKKQAAELKGKGGTEYGFVFQADQYEGLVCDALEYMMGNGGNVLDNDGKVIVDSPNNVEALKYFSDLVQSDFVPKGVTTYKEEDARQVFTEGKSVFMRNWPYAWAGAQADGSKVKDKVGIAPMPVGPKGTEAAATLGGWNLAVNANVDKDKKDAAIKFIKFVISPEGQKILALDGGKLPVLKSAYEDKDILAKNPHFKDLYNVFISAKPRPVSPVYPQISDVMQIQIHKAITGKQSPEDAAKGMQQGIEDVLKKYGK